MPEGLHSSCCMQGLVESHVGNVALCPGCGVIHVTLQYVTVRLEPGAFAEFTQMLLQARVALARERTDSETQRGETAEETQRVH